MKVGDLVKCTGWKCPILIVGFKLNMQKTAEEKETYYRCLVGDDYIWFFETSLEVINESR